ncbi:MAG TPA: IS200/IS605 family transposase [Ignavibacteria bacterium]|nr:IS200/IS605 family transposase [Ignavibacteria bacterium]
MADSFSQLYIHLVFAVQGRHAQIEKSWKQELYSYIAGIIKNKGNKPIIINGTEDHVHIFFGLNPKNAISDLVRDIKNNSSNYIHEKNYLKGRFYWQEGYGAFSYSHSQINDVYNYIQNQEKHHASKSFREEYITMLQKYDIIFDMGKIFE